MFKNKITSLKVIKVFFLTFALLGFMISFQNCSGSGGKVKVAGGPDGGNVNLNSCDECSNKEASFTPSFDLTTGSVSSDILVGPLDLKNITNLAVDSPENCEATCIAYRDCASLATEDQPACERACSRQTGLCQPLEIEPDPYTLAGFTVPAGYKKINVTVEHCTDRNDMLIVEGATFRIGYPLEGKPTGLGPDCKKEGLLDIAKVKVRKYNSSGQLGTAKEYVWKLPSKASFYLSMINDIDASKPTFAHLKAVEGPGVKLHKIYDNHSYNGQLMFVMQYRFWYDPKYTTEFDLYYKKLIE